jgi:hypothetical protein
MTAALEQPKKLPEKPQLLAPPVHAAARQLLAQTFPKYQVIAQGNAVILTLTKNAAQLVADALDIINPDEAQNENLARAIALDIQNAL